MLNLKNKLLEDFKTTENKTKRRVIRVLLNEMSELEEETFENHLYQSRDRLRSNFSKDEVKYLNAYLEGIE